MLFNREFFIIILWSASFQLKFIWAGRGEDDHVHIKVHVPQVYKKHVHHKTVAKHHYHPKKSHHHKPPHYESHVLGNIEPQIDFPLLTGPTISKYVKWQEKHNSAPITWYSDSPTGFPTDKSKLFNNSPLKSDSTLDEYKLSNFKSNSFNLESDPDHFSSHKFPQYQPEQLHQYSPHSMVSLKDFRINADSDYKNYPVKTFSGAGGLSIFDDDHHHHHHREHDHEEYAAEEDTDSYMENTETLTMPSALPYTAGAQSMMTVGDNDDYYDSSSISTTGEDSYANFNTNWMHNSNGKRNNNHYNNYNMPKFNKRPYRENVPLKLYGENSWISHSPENLFNDWNHSINNNNGFGKKRPARGGLNNTKMKGRKPFGFGGLVSNQNEHQSMGLNENTNKNSNFESYIGNEFGPHVLNEFHKRNKRPRRKSKPKSNKFLHNDTEFKF